jgi:hypothetical protein
MRNASGFSFNGFISARIPGRHRTPARPGKSLILFAAMGPLWLPAHHAARLIIKPAEGQKTLPSRTHWLNTDWTRLTYNEGHRRETNVDDKSATRVKAYRARLG